MTKYPPYSLMAAVLVVSEMQEMAKECIENLAAVLQKQGDENIEIIGPTAAGLSRAKDRYRYILYIKAKNEQTMEKMKVEWEAFSRETKWERFCSIQFDLNPLSGY